MFSKPLHGTQLLIKDNKLVIGYSLSLLKGKTKVVFVCVKDALNASLIDVITAANATSVF